MLKRIHVLAGVGLIPGDGKTDLTRVLMNFPLQLKGVFD
jgi:hypothetical protein